MSKVNELWRIAMVAMTLGAGCQATAPRGIEDGRDDDLVAGSADAAVVAEGSAEARGVLRVANELSASMLRSAVHLSRRVATNLEGYRLGGDGRAGTSDDERYDTIHELDGVRYVGPATIRAMLAYARLQGWVLGEDAGVRDLSDAGATDAGAFPFEGDSGLRDGGGVDSDGGSAPAPDAGTIGVDAGEAYADAGTSPSDAGAAAMDAGPGRTDAGGGLSPDAGPPIPDGPDPDPAAAAAAAGIAVADIPILLEVANTAPMDQLENQAIPSFVAATIWEGRATEPYRSVARLDARPYVGRETMAAMVAYGKRLRDLASDDGCVTPASSDPAALNGTYRRFFAPDAIAWPVAVATDSAVVLIGSNGSGPSPVHPRTLTVNAGGTWGWTSDVGPVGASIPTYGFSAVVDPVTARILVIGGYATAYRGESSPTTYAWSPTRGFEAVASRAELALSFSGVAADPERRRVVLFAGSRSGSFTNAIWEWDGSVWSRPAVPTGEPVPDLRELPAAAYDPTRHAVVFAGGRSLSDTAFADVWSWNGAHFTRLPDLPYGVVGGAMTYDARNRRLVLAAGARMLTGRAWDGQRVQRSAVLALDDGARTWHVLGAAIGYSTGADRLVAEPSSGMLVLPSGNQVVDLAPTPFVNAAPRLDELSSRVDASGLHVSLRPYDADFDPLRYRIAGGSSTWANARSGEALPINLGATAGTIAAYSVVISDGYACDRRTYSVSPVAPLSVDGSRGVSTMLVDCGSGPRIDTRCSGGGSARGLIVQCVVGERHFWGVTASYAIRSADVERTTRMVLQEILATGERGMSMNATLFETRPHAPFSADTLSIEYTNERGQRCAAGGAYN